MTIFCTRCGEELTAPKFHNRKPYGYSCYEIITGKKPKDLRKYVEVEFTAPIPDANYFSVTVICQGKRFRLNGILRDANGNLHHALARFEGDRVYMVTHDRKGKPVWKSI